LGGECDGVDALRAAVRERVERGCDVIKVMTTGGGLTPTFPMWDAQFTDAEVRAIVDEAHAAGLPVAAHCHGVAGIVQALDAGADTLEHCTFMNAEGKCEPVEEVLVRIADSDVVVSATLGHLPDAVPPPFIAANLEIIFGALRHARELGATIVAGTDAGVGMGKPHDILPTALAEFVDNGMTPVDGLRALTSVAAKACRVSDRKGRLAPGFDADLLAVQGNPVTDVGALMRPRQVWRAGRACL
jgi:imidazolonepropionase-like amidohydrolase